MKGHDARSLDHTTLEYVRFRAVKAVHEGYSVREVARIFGVHRSRVHEWVKTAREEGMDALRAKPVPGSKPTLDDKQIKKLVFLISLWTPLDFGWGTTLWTLKLIKALIEQEFSVQLSISAVGRLLHRLGITPQRPKRHAIEQDPVKVRHWLEEEFPKIIDLANEKGATIYFLDESGVRNDHHAGTTWSIEGLTPIIPRSGQHYRINMIIVASAEGELHFQGGPQRLTGEAFVEYLKKLDKEISKPIIIIADNHPAHFAEVVKEYLETTDGKIQIFPLPAYSPELNPIELIWNEIKSHGFARQLITSAEDLKDKATQLLESLKGMPEKVRRFFMGEFVKYIPQPVSSN